ncbi:DUF624 domain-containing protein [Lederbergia citrea]|uniref:DUF624 domain-containing protein n=1 Tax=Lederbergia citrea TaxID=2833581 RepID=UPI001BC9DD50|nr:DUF624 domain-containing protein [Lederbergia citrea]
MKASLRVFHKSIFETYHQLGFVLRISLLWLLCSIPIVTIGFATIGLLYSIEKKQKGEDDFHHFFKGMKKYRKPTLLLSALYAVIMIPGGIYFSILFTLNHIMAISFSFALLYLMFGVQFMMMYMVSLMVKQNLLDVKLIIIRSFRLFIENVSFTLNLSIYILLITILSLLVPILLLVWAGLLGFIAYYSLLYLLAKYESRPYEADLEVSWRGAWKPWKAY